MTGVQPGSDHRSQPTKRSYFKGLAEDLVTGLHKHVALIVFCHLKLVLFGKGGLNGLAVTADLGRIPDQPASQPTRLPAPLRKALATMVEQLLDDFVTHHANPPAPEVTEVPSWR